MRILRLLPLLVILLVASCSQKNQEVPSEHIVVTSPSPYETVSSPLTITGKAKGTWYFEASFPIELIDADGQQLAIVPAQALDDWMTEEFVDFTTTMTFTTDASSGYLILKKDNPSGLPEYDDEISIPIRF